jgi:hypothetical protein
VRQLWQEWVVIMKSSLLFGLLFVSGAAAAQPSSGTSGTSAPAASYDPRQVICRVSGETGSRLERTRVCMTRAEWDQRRRDTRAGVDRAQTGRTLPTDH